MENFEINLDNWDSYKPQKKSAVDIFTDRTEPREVFKQHLESIFQEIKEQKPKIHVLNFYGFAGIGKSTLIKKLEKEADPRAKIIKVNIDGNANFLTNPREIITNIMKEMEKNYKIHNFPRTMYAMYLQHLKGGESYSFKIEKESNEFIKRGLNVAKDLAMEFIPFKSYISLGKTIFKDLRGEASNELSQKQVKEIFLEGVKGSKQGEAEIDFMEHYSVEELSKKLTEYFCKDLRVITRYSGPFIFLIDSFEYRTADIGASSMLSSATESFLQTIIPQVPFALWVIAGREKLIKGEGNFWGKLGLEEHFLEALSREDIKAYLNYAGIHESLLDTFMNLSKGNPFMLDLLYEQYLALYDEEATSTIYPHLDPANYGEMGELVIHKIIDRYLRYYKTEASQFLFYALLSIDLGWTDELVEGIAPYLPKFDELVYENIKNLSIIKKTGELYSFHDAARDILMTTLPSEIKKSTDTALLNYLKNKVNSSTFSESTEDIKRILSLDLPEVNEIFETLIASKLMALINSWRLEEALGIILLAKKKYSRASDNYRFAYDYCCYFYNLNKGNGKGALHHAGSCLKIVKGGNKLRAKYYVDWDFISAYVLFKSGNYRDALNLFESCYTKQVEAFGENSFETLTSKRMIGICESKLGNYNQSLQVHEMLLAQNERSFGASSLETNKVLSDVAKDLIDAGRYQEAIEKCDTAYNNLKALNGGKESPDSLSALLNKAQCYEKLRKDEAVELAEYCQANFANLLGKRHYNTVFASYVMACCYYLVGRTSEAKDWFENVYSIWKNELGEDHPDTLDAQYGILLCATEPSNTENTIASSTKAIFVQKVVESTEKDEALKLLLTDYDLLRKKDGFGENHPTTLKFLSRIAYWYFIRTDYQSALSYYQKILAGQKQVLGDQHPDVAETLDFMARCFSCCSKLEEALAFAKQSLDIKNIIFGETNINSLVTASLIPLIQIISDCESNGNEALSSLQRCYQVSKEVLGEKSYTSVFIKYEIIMCQVLMEEQDEQVLKEFEENLQLFTEVLGEKSILVANMYAMLAVATEDTPNSLNYARKSYEITHEIFGTEHPLTINSTFAVFFNLFEQEEYDKALPYAEEFYNETYNLYGEDGVAPLLGKGFSTLDALFFLAECLYFIDGREAEALVKFQLYYEKTKDNPAEFTEDAKERIQDCLEILAKEDCEDEVSEDASDGK